MVPMVNCWWLTVLAFAGLVQYARPNNNNINNNKNNKVLMLFVDGLRWDLVRQSDLTGFNQFFTSGTRARHLKPVFPSLCYPNFYTMVTGLYPESHGLVGNNIYDPVANDFFSSRSDPERSAGDHWWHGGEPIWVTAAKQEKRSHLYYMVGCDREIHGVRPATCRKFRNDVDLASMLDSVHEGLTKMENDQADFVGVYYGEIDTVGHQYGVGSTQMKEKLKELDKTINYLLHDIWERGLSGEVNVVLVSDHGMTDSSIERTIDLRSLLSMKDVDHILESGAYVSIWPKPDKIEKVYRRLKTEPHLKVYLKDEIPESWHYKSSHRVPPIVALAETGWYIVTPETGYLGFGPRKKPAVGMHGYDVDHQDMWGVFAAVGPDIEINKTIEAVSVVDVYQVLSRLLNLQPRPHNGTWSRVAPMIRRASRGPTQMELLAAFPPELRAVPHSLSTNPNSAHSAFSLPLVTMVTMSLLAMSEFV